jgi:tRNA modification GTPase
MLPCLDETICALATPPGTGGLGVIRVSGPQAFTVADAVTQRPRHIPCRDHAGHTLHRAIVLGKEGDAIDDVLLTVFHGPRSYTGEDVVEISGHGGIVPLRRILTRLLESGARLAEPGEFTLRAFLNGKMDLAQAEAVGDAIAAQTEEAHRLARRQNRLSDAVGQIRERLLGVLARIEASIDFPEEVGELDTQFCEREVSVVREEIHTLLATADQGILYREGLKLVLAGRPNVGKSSLLNALLRTARAIVTPIPGTTRDVIEETMNLRGIPLRAVDTAGLRETEDEVEQIGVARTRESLASADLVLLVLDATVGETPEDSVLQAELAERPYLIVWNKWDLINLSDEGPPSVPSPFGRRGWTGLPGRVRYSGGVEVPVSAATGWNITGLEEAIVECVLSGQAAPQEAQGAVVTHTRHRQALETARARLEDALATLEANLPADFLAIDVQAARTALGEITGQTVPEDVISEIFSRFCIGK